MMHGLTGAVTTALREYPAIWRATTVQRDPRTMTVMRWLTGVLGTIAIIMLIVLGAGRDVAPAGLPLVALRMVLGIGAFWVAVIWFVLFVPASVQLNSAANARLLPRQRRRLLQMAAAGWLATTFGFTVASGIWPMLPLIGLYLLGFMLMRGGSAWAICLIVIPSNWTLLSRMLPPALVSGLRSDAGLLVASVLLLLAAAWALHWLYPAASDVHLDKRAARLKRIERSSGKFSVRGSTQDSARLSAGPAYRAALRAHSRRRDPGALLIHALGPVGHWSTWLPSMALLLVLGIGVRLVMTWSGGALDAPVQVAANIGAGPLVMLILFSTAHYGQQMGKTRGEQALLRLTPLAGAAALLNRRLAGQLLRRTLVNWAMLTVLMLVLVVLIGGDRAALLRQLGLCCLAGQVALAGLLGDYAGGFGWNWALGSRAAAVAALQAGVAVVLGLASGGIAWIWVWLIVIAVVTAYLSVRRDWRRMLAAPPAFPAGRPY
jgi:hypothetical protein